MAHGHAALANGPSPHASPAMPVMGGQAKAEPQQATLKEQVASWTERVLVPAIQRQVGAPLCCQLNAVPRLWCLKCSLMFTLV